MRLDYAQFLELDTFTRFGGMPDTRVRDQLTRGARIRAILNRAQHSPLRLADEVALVLAVQSGLLDALPLPAVIAFRRGLHDALDAGAADVVHQVEAGGTMIGPSHDYKRHGTTALFAAHADIRLPRSSRP